MPTIKKQDDPAEIDILYLFRPVFRGLERIGQFFLYWLMLIGRNRWLFLVIFLLVAGWGYGLRFFTTQYYQTEAVFATRNLPSEMASYLIHNVDQYAGTARNIPMLGQLLGINLRDAETIISIAVEKISDSTYLDKEDSPASIFKVVLLNTDTSSLDAIQKGIKNVLENNEYSLKRKEARIKAIESMIGELQLHIINGDSLYPGRAPLWKGASIQAENRTSVYNESLYFYNKLKTDRELLLMDNVELLQPFVKYNRYNYPNFTPVFQKYVLMGLLLAFLVTPIAGTRRLNN